MRSILHLNIIAKILGINLLIISAFLIASTSVALIYHEPVTPFLYSALAAGIPGLFLFYSENGVTRYEKFTRRDAYLTVTLSWILLGLVAALPYLFSQSIPRFVDALFESISGVSTTGASVLTDIEALPFSILFWRSMTHWIGGIGIIMLVVVIMPSFKIGGYHLFTMESSLQEKIKPRTSSIGSRLLLIYIILTLLETMLLLAGGMNLFESLCHSFGTIATGGFSPKNDSIASYSPYIQYVIMLFMLLAGVNFSIYYFAVKGEFNRIKTNSEFSFYLFVVFIIGVILTWIIYSKLHLPIEESAREAYFTLISIISCTGFATADYLRWPVYGWFIIFLAMFLGGSTGSTSGSIKMARHLILLKNIQAIFKRMVHPTGIISVRFNQKPLPEDFSNYTLSFILLYLSFFAAATIIMVLLGIDLETSAGSVATCMAGIGPGLGTTGPVSNFGHLPDSVKLLLSVMMLLGRLEIYTVLVLFSSRFWKN